MKIPRTKTRKSRGHFIAHLERQGCRLLGSGAFSDVYTHPTDPKRVLKISLTFTGRIHNDPYLAFLEQLDESTLTNPLLPKVYNIAMYWPTTWQKGWWYVVEMERLSNFSKLKHEVRLELIKTTGVVRSFALIDRHPLGNAQAEQVRKIIRRLMSRGFNSDLHKDNIMLRRKRGQPAQVVITDPVM